MEGRMKPTHIRKIGALIKSTESKALLDYGCGKAQHYISDKIHERWNVEMPKLYDPAIDEFAEMPTCTFDGVICKDVMEHIPECAIDKTLDHIMSLAERFVYCHISTRPAHATLLNGENAHVTIRDHDWWLEKIQKLRDENNYSCFILVSTQKGLTIKSIAQVIIRE